MPRVTSMTERRKALLTKSSRKPARASSDAFSDGDSVSSLDTFAHSVRGAGAVSVGACTQV